MVDPGAASLPSIAPILLLATQLRNEVRRWEERCEVVMESGRSKVEELERRKEEVAATIAARSSEAMEVEAAIWAKRGEVATIRKELEIRRAEGGQWRRKEQGGAYGGTIEEVQRVEEEEAPTSPVAGDITFHPLPSMCSSPLPATGLSHSQEAMEVAGGGWGVQGTGGMEMVGDMNNGREEDSIVKLVVVQVKEGGEDWLEDQLAAMAELVRRERRRYREEIGGRLATVHEEAMGEVIRMAFHPITLPGTPRHDSSAEHSLASSSFLQPLPQPSLQPSSQAPKHGVWLDLSLPSSTCSHLPSASSSSLPADKNFGKPCDKDLP